jgi:hypothetical protein
MMPVMPFEIFQNTSPSVIAVIRSLFDRSAGLRRSRERLASLPEPVSPWQKMQLPFVRSKKSALPFSIDSGLDAIGFLVLSASSGSS